MFTYLVLQMFEPVIIRNTANVNSQLKSCQIVRSSKYNRGIQLFQISNYVSQEWQAVEIRLQSSEDIGLCAKHKEPTGQVE